MTTQAIASEPAVTTNAQQRIALSLIRRNAKVDPRRGRNKGRYESMKNSILAQGVLQPILVRPTGDPDVPYEVVYGHTRFDISCEIDAPDIPANIRELTDAQARVIAGTENLQRADLTPIEEAYHVVELLTDCNNDFVEVGKITGWSRTKLESRVLLSKCCDDVAEALVQGQIKLGHAELLAPMTEADQREICARIIERNLTVVQTRERLAQMTPVISTARFDTTGCQNCEHNSGRYNDLFDTSVGDAKCQNTSCWTSKNAELIEVRLIEASKEYGVVYTDTTLPDGSYVLLEENGPDGVGAQQLAACTSCASYGAVVKTSAGQEGNLAGGHCFNKTCHEEHKAAYTALIANATATPQPQDNPQAVATGEPETARLGATTSKKPATAAASKSSKPKEVKKSIKKEAFSLYSRMAAQAIQNSPEYTLAIAIVSLYLEMKTDLPQDVQSRLQKAAGFPSSVYGTERVKVEASLAKRPVAELQGILAELASSTVFRRDSADQFEKSVPGAQALEVIKAAQLDPVDHFEMSEAYLNALTKAGVVADCKASGFEARYDEVKGAKEFAKLASGKVDDLVKAILDFTDFSWVGFLPEAFKVSAHDGSGTASANPQ